MILYDLYQNYNSVKSYRLILIWFPRQRLRCLKLSAILVTKETLSLIIIIYINFYQFIILHTLYYYIQQ